VNLLERPESKESREEAAAAEEAEDEDLVVAEV
jgi:hypothetical protein